MSGMLGLPKNAYVPKDPIKIKVKMIKAIDLLRFGEFFGFCLSDFDLLSAKRILLETSIFAASLSAILKTPFSKSFSTSTN